MVNKKILVGGGAGYLGSVLVPALIDHGYEVLVIDSLWFGNHLPKSVRLIKKNLFECTAKDMQGFDTFVFLAGVSNDPMAEFNPAKNFIYNAALPAYLAFEAKKAGVKRFIYASSCSIYGYAPDKFYDEESPITCDYPYGISKLQGERGVYQMVDEDFSVICLRQGTICGYSPRMRFDLIVNAMFKTAMQDGKIVVNNPAIWRPIFHMQDAVVAFIRAVQADNSLSGIFNVTSDNYTVGQVGDMVKFEVEKHTDKTIKLEIKNIEDFRNYKVSIEKARITLGFQPMYTIIDIVADLFAHKREYGNYVQDKYYNINIFKKLKI